MWCEYKNTKQKHQLARSVSFPKLHSFKLSNRAEDFRNKSQLVVAYTATRSYNNLSQLWEVLTASLIFLSTSLAERGGVTVSGDGILTGERRGDTAGSYDAWNRYSKVINAKIHSWVWSHLLKGKTINSLTWSVFLHPSPPFHKSNSSADS